MLATAVFHDAFVVGQAPLDEQLAESAQLLEWARATGRCPRLLAAHRAPCVRSPRRRRACRQWMPRSLRSVGSPSRCAVPDTCGGRRLWSAMRALLEGRHEVAEERALAAYELGSPRSRRWRSSTCRSCCSSCDVSRVASPRWSRRRASTRRRMPTYLRIRVVRSRSCSPSSAASTRHAARCAQFDDDRAGQAARPQLARLVVPAGARRVGRRRRALAATLLEPHNRPAERCVQVSLATVCLGADRSGGGLAVAHRRRPRCGRSPLPVGGGAQRPHRSPKLARPDPSRPRPLLLDARSGTRRAGAPTSRSGPSGRLARRSRSLDRATVPGATCRNCRSAFRVRVVWELDFAESAAQVPTPAACATSPTSSADRARRCRCWSCATISVQRRRTPAVRRRSTSGPGARSASGSTSSTPTKPKPRRPATGSGPRWPASNARSSPRRWPATSGSAAAPGDRRSGRTGPQDGLDPHPADDRDDRPSPSRARPPPRALDRHRHLVRLPPGRAGRLANLTRRDATSDVAP